MKKQIKLKNKLKKSWIILLISLVVLAFYFSSGLTSAITSSADTNFIIILDNPYCSLDGTEWQEGFNKKSSLEDCYKVNGIGKNNVPMPNCCPVSFFCNQGSKECEEGGAEDCRSYISLEECLNFSYSVAKADAENINGRGFCEEHWTEEGEDYERNCRCIWGSNEKCYSAWDKKNDSAELLKIEGTCIRTYFEDTGCEEREIGIIFFANNWTGGVGRPESCPATGQIEYSCVSGVLLSFFSISSLILAIIIIIVFYWIVIKKRKKFR